MQQNNEKINGDLLFHMLGVKDYEIRILSEKVAKLEKELASKESKPLQTDPVE